MFDDIISNLNRYFCGKWFLDSGSLLGIVRDKQFLKTDLGIDISVLCDSTTRESIVPFVKAIEQDGFITSTYEWEGVPYKYCFVPRKDNRCKYSFDIHLFMPKEPLGYCCPQISLQKTGFSIWNSFRALKKGNPLIHRNGLMGDIKYLIGYVYRYCFKYFGAKMNMSKYAREGGKVFFWVIPFHMLHGVETGIDGFNILIDPNEYLTYRYNNWRVPVSDWVTLRDDGGLVPCDYKDISAFMNEFWK